MSTHAPRNSHEFLFTHERRRARGGSMWRFFRVGGEILALIVGFVVALVVGVLVHLDIHSARALVAREVTAALGPTFKGRIVVDRIGGLGLFGIAGTDVTIEDPHGAPVIVVRGARVHWLTWAVVRSAVLESKGPLLVKLPKVVLDRVEARLDTDSKGNLLIAQSFEPRTPSNAPPDPNARGLRLEISNIFLRHGWVHGNLSGAPPIDVDLDGLEGSFLTSPEALEGDVRKLAILARRIANGADVKGTLAAHLNDPSDPKAKLGVRAVWHGVAGTIAHSIEAKLENDRVDAVVDAPSIAPADARAVWPASPLEQAGSLHLEAHGPLTAIDVALRAAIGQGLALVHGRVSIGDAKTATLRIDVSNADAHAVMASAPTTRLGLQGDVHADMAKDGALSGNAAVHFAGGSVGDEDIPSVQITADGARRANGDLKAHARVVVEEPKAPTRLEATVATHHGSPIADFDLRADADDLDAVPELRHRVKGQVHLGAKGTIDTKKLVVDAKAQVHARSIAAAGDKVEALDVDVDATGALADPGLDVRVRSRGLLVAGRRVESADVRMKGRLEGAHVEAQVRTPDLPNVDATLGVAVRPQLAIEPARVVLARAGEQATITVDRVSFAGPDVRVDGLRVEGVGDPLTATVALDGASVRARASSNGLDVARIGRLAHLEDQLKGGTVAVDADVDVQRASVRGHVAVDAVDVALKTMGGLTAHVDLGADGRKVHATVHADAGRVGTMDLDAQDVTVAGGGPLLAASWRQIWGTVDVKGRLDLREAAERLPTDTLPFDEAQGTVTFDGRLERDDLTDVTPDVTLNVKTEGLIFSPRTPRHRDLDGVVIVGPAPWRLAGIDLVLHGRADGSSGSVDLTADLRDKRGALMHLIGRAASFPFATLYGDGSRLNEALRRTSFDVQAIVPTRGLGSLPDILKQNYVVGKIAADVKIAGSMGKPTVDADVTLKGSHFSQVNNKDTIDFAMLAHYDGEQGTVSVKANHAGQVALDLEAKLAASLAALTGQAAGPPWKASAKAHFADFPLEVVPAMDEKLVSGRVNGDVDLEGLHTDARAHAALSIDRLKMGSFTYKSAKIDAEADGKGLKARVRMEQPDGYAQVDAKAVAGWGSAMAPVLDPNAPLDATLSSKNFRVAVLLPFVESTLDELDGRLDADTRLELDPKTRRPTLTGQMDFSRGTVEAVAGGGEFHDIAAHWTFAKDGTITLDKMTAAGLSGRLQANAVVKLDGTTLRSARASVVIPSRTAIPLSAGGAEIGVVDGRFDIVGAAVDQGKGMDVKVHVPHVKVALPEGNNNSPIELGDMSGVRIGAHRGRTDSFVLVPLDPSEAQLPAASSQGGGGGLHIETALDDVQVVRGTDIAIDLDGKVDVRTGAQTAVTGTIHLKPGGKISVQGKNFLVERGDVTFADDPSNPEVIVRAGWTALDGTVVYANFVGPLKTGKVTLTSEPPLSNQDIVALLLYGTVDGPQAQSPSADSTTSAIGTVGGQAAQPLNHMLNQFGLGAVSVKVDTEQSSAPKPEVEVQVARDISLQIAVVLGVPPPGVNPDRTLVTVDWRFVNRWSLSTTLGDAGSALFDVLWRRRY